VNIKKYYWLIHAPITPLSCYYGLLHYTNCTTTQSLYLSSHHGSSEMLQCVEPRTVYLKRCSHCARHSTTPDDVASGVVWCRAQCEHRFRAV